MRLQRDQGGLRSFVRAQIRFGLNCICQILRMEAEWAWLALVEHATTGCHQIHAIRPPRVCRLDAVIKSIHQSRELDSQLPNAGAGHGIRVLPRPADCGRARRLSRWIASATHP